MINLYNRNINFNFNKLRLKFKKNRMIIQNKKQEGKIFFYILPSLYNTCPSVSIYEIWRLIMKNIEQWIYLHLSLENEDLGKAKR